MNTLNLQSVKELKHDKTAKALAKDILKARSKCEYVKLILEPKISELIKSYGYRDDEGKLLDNFDTFFEFFYDEDIATDFTYGKEIDTLTIDLHNLYIENGFDIQYSYSPILLAEYELTKAEDALINYTSKYTTISTDSYAFYTVREDLLKLTMNFLI